MNTNIQNYAVTEQNSRNRKFPQPPHPYRTAFGRDRDRIIHSSALRRLAGKTQVFTPGLDDNYRTRYTHSIEVSQIARTIASALGVNELLTEAVCLAHDIGHSPFGHAGETILNEISKDFGGFEHNAQSLRIVDFLEHPYPDFAGLNLMYETRLALAKHHTPYDNTQNTLFDEPVCSLEGQISDLADRIAYNCHDTEDGIRAGIISPKMLSELEIFNQAKALISADSIADDHIRSVRTAKAIIDILVSDCINTTTKNLRDNNIQTIADIYNHKNNLAALSETGEKNLRELEAFLLKNFYMSDQVTSHTDQIRSWLNQLFCRFTSQPQQMPEYYHKTVVDHDGIERAVCDYIAGMTDRYCLKIVNEK
jgi:dGTPase